MSYIGIGFRVKEGIIQFIEQIDSADIDRIRVVVKSSREGSGVPSGHAMLNVEDDTFVSVERFHSIITTYKELSECIHYMVNNENKESIYNTNLVFSRYAKDVYSTLQEVSQKTKAFRLPHSRTINNQSLRIDYDWLYISSLNLDDSEENNAECKKKIYDYIQKTVGEKYQIGNFRTHAMRLTEMTDHEMSIMIKAREENKRGYWKIHSPIKLCYQNQFHKCSEYRFDYNYRIIGNGAFRGFSRIEYIVLPLSVKYIGIGTFASCTAMKRITLPNGLIDIGMYCFANCTSLNNIIIPNTVEEIGSYAFEGCESLTSIILPDELKYIGRHVFDGCPDELKIYINENYQTGLSKVLDEYKDKIETVNEFSLKLRRAAIM